MRETFDWARESGKAMPGSGPGPAAFAGTGAGTGQGRRKHCIDGWFRLTAIVLRMRQASILAFCVTGAGPLAAGVVTNVADGGAGSLRQVIAGEAAGGVITFAAGLSGQTIRLTTGQLGIAKNLTIDASALPAGIVISGDADASGTPTAGDSRVFKISQGGHTVVMKRLTITGGAAPATFLEEVGGGIYNDEGDLTLVECVVSNNGANLGFGPSGGGIYSQLGSLTLDRTTVTANESLYGGGIAQYAGTIEATNCTIGGNTASGDGGGIYNLSGSVVLTSCTVSGNSADYGGGVFNGDPPSPVVVDDSIVAGNSASVGNANLRGNFTANGSVVAGDPLLLPLGLYGGQVPVMPPQAGSPAINAALASLLVLDQRGAPRPQGAAKDAGAVEVADGGYAEEPLKLTHASYNRVTGITVLRWLNPGGTFVVESSADLVFGVAGDAEIPVNASHGTVDLSTWPGQIQFTFADPAATGPRHFWRVVTD